MLRELSIQNLALAEDVSLVFDEGLNVLTGETGAGKSLVVDAVSFLLGVRMDKDIIRSGSTKTVVEGVFDLPNNQAIRDKLEALSIDLSSDSLSLSREISLTGRGVCRIEGSPVALASYRAIADTLMNLHGQHEHQALMDEKNHLEFLDAFGDASHQEALGDMARAHVVWHEAEKRYQKLKALALTREERAAKLKQQIEELKGAQLKPGEDAELKQKKERLRSADKLNTALTQAFDKLYDQAGDTALSLLQEAGEPLSSVASLGDEYHALAQRAEALYFDLEDLALTIRQAREQLQLDDMTLDSVEERLDLIRRLGRKYGAEIEDMLAYLQNAEQELGDLQGLEEKTDEALAEVEKCEKEMLQKARALSKQRQALGQAVQSALEGELAQLNMKNTRFLFDIEASDRTVSATGIDKVRMLISPNVGEDPRPLSKIASGGELSRVMLAIKALSAQHDAVGAMVFDEVDQGVSGRTAQIVAKKLWDIARYRQVICVTHLQQIAVMGTRHFLVEKHVKEGRTFSGATILGDDDRANEIMRMLGEVSTDSAAGLAHAGDMLREADSYRQATPRVGTPLPV